MGECDECGGDAYGWGVIIGEVLLCKQCAALRGWEEAIDDEPDDPAEVGFLERRGLR